MSSHQLSDTYECPQCSKVLDGCTSVVGQRAPRLGDLSVCIYCKTFLQFGEGTFTVLSEAEFKQMDAEIQFALLRVKQAILDYERTTPEQG